MISIQQAYQYILNNKKDFGTTEVPLLQSIERILATPVLADADFPAFHRVTMDGIAINSKAFANGQRAFNIEQMQAAGQPQTTLRQEDGCIEIMTGAVLPAGTDAVIQYEQCEIDNGIATIKAEKAEPFQNIHLQGSDSKKGNQLLAAGVKIIPAIVGILASVGMDNVPVKKLPRIAVISTGDELVAINETPHPHQIRRSNVYTLAAALLQLGITASLHHLPDEPMQMKAQLLPILAQHDCVLFSGAVSMGKKDFLPVVLQELGMQTIFHKVAQKPGKPLLFGNFENGPTIFGFPGNPTSTLACFHIFFRKWLVASLGLEEPKQSAKLSEDFTFNPKVSFHLPVQVINENAKLWARPGFGTNSGDAVSLSKADGIITLPAEQAEFKKGEAFELVMF
jgi:molybdopterin molybdotransferase